MNGKHAPYRTHGLRPIQAWALLLVIIAGWWWRVFHSEWYSAQPPFDALQFYLPLAKKFLLDPVAVWFAPERIAVAPGSFLYFALFGADPGRALQGNLWLSTFTIVLLFDGVRRLGSWWAGLAAAAFFAASPDLPSVVLPLMTEAPYFFLVALWLWASIRIGIEPSGWAVVILGAGAISAATLTRATHLYWIAAAPIGGGLAWWWAHRAGSTSGRRYFLRFTVMHLLAAAPLVAYVALNAHTHQTHKFITGSGAALYFGMNAAIGGEEPPYFGLLHWPQAAYHGDQGHLEMDADKQLNDVAKAIALDMPKLDLIGLLQHKVTANLFFSSSHLNGRHFARVVRIVLIFFSLWALVGRYRQPFFQIMAALLCYHVAILSLLMYNQRYSIGGLELPLVVLAGVGVSDFFASQLKWRTRSLWLAVLLLALIVGAWNLRSAPPAMPDLTKVPHMQLGKLDPGTASTSGAAGSVFRPGAQVLRGKLRVQWGDVHYRDIFATPILQIPVLEGAPRCDTLHMAYEVPGQAARSQSVSLKRLTSPVVLNLGTLRLNSLTPQAGILTLDFFCPEGSRLRLGQVTLEGITLGSYYRDQAGAAQKAR